MKEPEYLARICHEACRVVDVLEKNYDIPHWSNLLHARRQAAIATVILCQQHANKPVGYIHDVWVERKKSEGWTYGDPVDFAAKKHPHMLAFDDLPESQRIKDGLFKAIVDFFTKGETDDRLID